MSRCQKLAPATTDIPDVVENRDLINALLDETLDEGVSLNMVG